MASKNLVGESFLATVGLDAFLDPEPLRVTAEQRDRALRYSSEMRDQLNSFLTNGAFDRGEPLPAFNYRKVLGQLSDFPTDEEQQMHYIADKLAGFRVSPEAAVPFTHAAGGAVQYLQGVIPRRQRVTSTGPVLIQPNGQELSRFRRVHAAVQDPMSVFADLRQGVMTKDQVTALAEVYPALYEDAKASGQQLLTKLKAEKNSFALGYGKERMLQRFMGIDKIDPQLTRALQESFRPGNDKTASDGGQLNISPGVQGQTPTQRIAAK
jgi:hypothetical protein